MAILNKQQGHEEQMSAAWSCDTYQTSQLHEHQDGKLSLTGCTNKTSKCKVENDSHEPHHFQGS